MNGRLLVVCHAPCGCGAHSCVAASAVLSENMPVSRDSTRTRRYQAATRKSRVSLSHGLLLFVPGAFVPCPRLVRCTLVLHSRFMCPLALPTSLVTHTDGSLSLHEPHAVGTKCPGVC